jgi:CheY-like chemotaxis protein
VLLLVEDDAGIRELARKILVSAGVSVHDVADGSAALDLWAARKGEIDLVLTDLVLPGELSGRDIALVVLRDRPELPVLYMSGFADDGEEHPYLTLKNFLRKPFSPDALRQLISAALR